MLVPSIQCERARRAASLAADGEISELESASLQAHLSTCPACAAYAMSLAELTRSLRTAPLVEPEWPVFVPQSRQPLRRSRVLQVGAAAVAVVAALGLGRLAGALTSPGSESRAAPAAVASTQAPYKEQTILALLGRTAERPHGRTQAV